MLEKNLRHAANLIKEASHFIALTGAGISVDSGIPAFRGSQGLWERYDPVDYAHITSFMADPAKVWVMLKELYQIMERAKPNPAHYALACLEELDFLKAIITQNIDALHQRAGSKNIIEFHGNADTLVCLYCGKETKSMDVDLDDIPPRCDHCHKILKPKVVFSASPFHQIPLRTRFSMPRSAI